MSEYRKREGDKYFLKKLNSETNQLEWVEIDMSRNSTISKESVDFYYESVYPNFVTISSDE
jgi:hypothetical protein